MKVGTATTWSTVASAAWHSAALKSDGTVWTWGDNTYGQLGDGTTTHRLAPVQVTALSGTFTAVAAGYDHTLALRNDNTIWAWGRNDKGQLGATTSDTCNELACARTPLQLTLTGAMSIAAGLDHSLAVSTDQTLWAWGGNAHGQVGNGTTTDQPTPTQVATAVSSAEAAELHSVARKTDGTVWTWGWNGNGQLGVGSTEQHTSPIQVGGLSGMSAVAAGSFFTLALRLSDGTVWSWGYNVDGEIGDGTTTDRLAPVQVVGVGGVGMLSGMSAISAGSAHSLALKSSDGSILGWGWNGMGALGKGGADRCSCTTPVNVRNSANSGNFVGATKISAGSFHTLARKSDGTLWAWGDDFYGQLGDGTATDRSLPVIIALGDVVAVSGGTGHSLALKGDGTVWAWGLNGNGQLGDGTTQDRLSPVQVKGVGGSGSLTGIIAISAGNYHNVALKGDGTVVAWGWNGVGQLGDGSQTTRTTPVQVQSLSSVVQIAAGGQHSLARKSDGSVSAWGNNTEGELGDGTNLFKTTPVSLTSLGAVSTIGAGYYHSLAAKPDGSLYAWGANGSSQLGGGGGDRNTPAIVSGISDVRVATGGAHHTLAITADGTVWAWGRNDFGQVGNGTTADAEPTPTPVVGLNGASAVAAGRLHSLALKSDGTTWAWGSGFYGALGTGTRDHQYVAVQITALGAAGAVAAGELHSLSTGSPRTEPAPQSWGDDTSGELGDDTTLADKTSPVAITGLLGPAALAAGGLHSLALMPDGTMKAWGENGDGQVGNNTTTDQRTPVPVSEIASAVAIAAGGKHSLAVLLDGTVRAWGKNSNGQLGDSTTTTRKTPVTVSGLTGVTAVSAGTSHSLALKSDGTVLAWGLNTNGRLGDGTTTQRKTPVPVLNLGGVTAIAAGGAHSLALTSDGSVWAWGLNTSGQLGDGTTTQRLVPVAVSGLTNVVAIAAGDNHSLALRSDGSLWAWGSNVSGQIGDNTSGSANNRATPVQVKGPGGVGNLQNVVSIDAGTAHSLAAKSDGTVWAWGSGADGRLGNGSTLQQNAPVQSGGLTSVTQVAAGTRHSLARTTQEQTQSYGYDRLYRLTADNPTTYGYDPVGSGLAIGRDDL